MKSQQLEIKTSCENCSFLISENGKQIGCNAGRLEKFIQQDKATLNENGYYEINRFCNMRRKEKSTVEEAYNKIKSKFGIAIFDEGDNFEDAIESCKKIQYDKNKFKISIYSKNRKIFGKLFEKVNDLKRSGIDARLFFDIEDRNISSSEKDVFQYLYGCSHLIKINGNTEIDPMFLFNINKSLNDDLEVFFTYELNNVYCAPFWIVNQQYLNYHSYDEMMKAIIEESINSSMHKKYA